MMVQKDVFANASVSCSISQQGEQKLSGMIPIWRLICIERHEWRSITRNQP